MIFKGKSLYPRLISLLKKAAPINIIGKTAVKGMFPANLYFRKANGWTIGLKIK